MSSGCITSFATVPENIETLVKAEYQTVWERWAYAHIHQASGPRVLAASKPLTVSPLHSPSCRAKRCLVPTGYTRVSERKVERGFRHSLA